MISKEILVCIKEMKLQIWQDEVALCFWCSFCIWLWQKQMYKKCRNIRDSGNSIQNPCGCNVLNLLIQKSSWFFGLYFNSPLSMLAPLNCAINLNLVYLLKLWPGNQKCWSTWSEFYLFPSFRYFFSLELKILIFTCVFFVA